MNPIRVNKHFFSVLLLLFTSSCFALPDDRAQIMHFRADTAELNHHTHRGIYVGDVQLDQGSTHIRAAEAITEGNLKNQLIKAIIKGNKAAQAHYWTLATADKLPVHAYADIIYYYPEKHSIELVGNAKVEQGTDSFSAPTIRYNTLNQCVVSENDSKSRTTITIHPGKRQ